MPAATTFPGRSLYDRETREGTIHSQIRARIANVNAVRESRWKLVWDLDSGHRGLFDLEADPTEATDATAKHPDEAARLARLAEQRLRDDVTRYRELHGHSPSFPNDAEALPPAVLDVLRAAGYVER